MRTQQQLEEVAAAVVVEGQEEVEGQEVVDVVEAFGHSRVAQGTRRLR